MDEKFISEFNENANKIFRLHNIWLECGRFSNEGRFEKWNWKLDEAKRELFSEAKRLSDKDNNYMKKLEELDKKILKAHIKKMKKSHYNFLQEKEILLRDIQQESGMGLTHKSVEEDDWD